jgi:hypothetical protein
VTPFRSPFAPVVPSPWGRRYYLGATQSPAPTPDQPDAWSQWVQVGANVFRTVGTDAARLINYVFPDTVSVPAVSDVGSAVGVGQEAYDIAQRGPTVQNVGGLGVGVARLWDSTKNLLGLGETASDAAATGAGTAVGEAIPVVGLGIGAYNLSENPSPGAAIGTGVAAAEVGAQAGAMAGFEGLAGASSVLGPVGLVMSLPFIIGGIFHTIARATGLTHGAFHPPAGYVAIDVPGYDAAAVDPATGRIMLYHDGHYTWSQQTLDGIPATPDQLTAWGVQPTGKLALQPGYADVEHFADEAVASGAPGQRYDVVQSVMMQSRAPAITALHTADPSASPAEIWRQYSITPEGQADIAEVARLTAPAERGGDS